MTSVAACEAWMTKDTQIWHRTVCSLYIYLEDLTLLLQSLCDFLLCVCWKYMWLKEEQDQRYQIFTFTWSFMQNGTTWRCTRKGRFAVHIYPVLGLSLCGEDRTVDDINISVSMWFLDEDGHTDITPLNCSVSYSLRFICRNIRSVSPSFSSPVDLICFQRR